MILRSSSHAFIRGAAAAIAVIPLVCSLSFTQNTPAGHTSSQDTAQSTSASLAAQSSSQTTSQSAPSSGPALPKKKLRGEFVVAPIPISSPALGSGIIPVLGYIFPLRNNDNVSPPSVIGAAGLITDNGSRAFAVGGQLFIKRDTYRITTTFFQGNLNYNLYGIGAVAGNAGVKLPLKQDGAAFLGEFLRRLMFKFFLGPRVLTGHSVVTRRPGPSVTVPIPPDTVLRTSLTSLGFSIQRDTRPNRFYPTTGTAFEFTSDFFADAFGSKYSFQSYRVTFNKYGSLSKNQVLAYNAFFCATGGQPPFYGNCIYGTRNELRGYEAGRYLDRYMIATQLEYRLVLPKRFGLVGFGGIGGVAPGGRDFFRNNAFLPAGGAGLRFMLSKTYHVNLRADLAAGKNEHTFSMGVSEAF
jgi:Omp85 superfamily domain